MTLRLVPLKRDQAKAYIRAHHRHNKRFCGDLFRVGCVAEGEVEMAGVAVVGRPVSRETQHREPQTCELLRLCVREGAPRNVASFLLGAVRRAAWALGYTKVITYTLKSESGASLRAAGYRTVGERPARPGWDASSRPRDNDDYLSTDRLLWEAAA